MNEHEKYLLDLPTIRPYLESLLGRNYRLDHDYIKIDNAKRRNELHLHGGGQGTGGASDLVGPTDGGQCYYRFSNDRFFNGLVAVAFELDTVLPGQGGFACIPGSHKVILRAVRNCVFCRSDLQVATLVRGNSDSRLNGAT